MRKHKSQAACQGVQRVDPLLTAELERDLDRNDGELRRESFLLEEASLQIRDRIGAGHAANLVTCNVGKQKVASNQSWIPCWNSIERLKVKKSTCLSEN